MECVSGSGGCYIGFATSWGKNHSPENVLDKKDGTFWITTGLFPQIMVISLDQPRKVSQVKIISSKVKALCVETSSHIKPDNFELKFEKTLPDSDGQLQITELPINDTHLHHIRLKILSGYNHFVAVYRVLFDGK
ncbi:unnamed protein product [Schistosoma rodhaini]|uniref:Heat shock protein family B (small) member 11 n=1 Tax=Schistosoma rodhaini TaxID=6188 RepID=A0A183QI83_9TREM|nr:unnamed protein product [Schistosoma rodhaini]CAH8602553.1 unnamed protein product [Schistosoma rodhaini]